MSGINCVVRAQPSGRKHHPSQCCRRAPDLARSGRPARSPTAYFATMIFFAELPFMQLNGHGSVNMPAASVDYSLSARVFDRPEFMEDVSPEELQDLTRVAIPLRITGPLASPKIGIDLEELLEDQVREELEDKIKDKLEDLFKL